MSRDELSNAAEAVESYFRDTTSSINPYLAYERLRELAPVYWSEPLGYWIVTGYAEGDALYRNPALSRYEASRRQLRWLRSPDDPPEVQRDIAAWSTTVLNMDDPDHGRLRRLLQPAFSQRSVSRWEGRTEQIVTNVFARIADEEEFDFLSQVAYPVPETVICEILGVPHEDHARWREWSKAVAAGFVVSATATAVSEDFRRSVVSGIVSWCEYFRALVAERRSGDGDDLISVLARLEEEGDRLTADELTGTCILTIGAGHETTANLISNAMLALLRNPAQYRKFRNDPSLAAKVVEETMRFDSPSRSQGRVALADIEVGGETIREGQLVMVTANACNRDPRRHEETNQFDLDREDVGHIAFAGGIHYCLGAALARMEAGIALRHVAELDAELELTRWPLPYRPAHGRAVATLPVRRVRH
ncbi:MAG: cytochrome P450 [Ilumatobacteraceae bacterium]